MPGILPESANCLNLILEILNSGNIPRPLPVNRHLFLILVDFIGSWRILAWIDCLIDKGRILLKARDLRDNRVVSYLKYNLRSSKSL